MIKIIEARPKIEKIFAYYYNGNKEELQEFLNIINKKLECSKLFIDKEDDAIMEYDKWSECSFLCCFFHPKQYIYVEFGGLNIDLTSELKCDLIRCSSMFEEEFDDKYITEKEKWLE
ncbi:MAG: hypothetical protein PHQ98_04925 [Candidatus ainarchaeum sp.]|nr:hypothetical protein [Candidatus ainarchaeum sp.]